MDIFIAPNEHRHARRRTRLGQTGDTIVEVLICLAIVATVLGGAFVTTRNSQLGVRNSQEHTIAIKLLQNQLEQMRANAGADEAIFSQAGTFCMFSNPNPDPALPSSGNCLVDSSGTPVTAATQPSFTLTITGCNNVGCGNSVANSFLFTATAKWSQVIGSTNAQEVMVYRLYQ